MTESEIEATGLDREYTPPPLKKIVALVIGGMFTQVMFFAAFRIQLYALKVLGLSAILIAIFMIIFTLVDILNEYAVGHLSDKSTRFTKRYGKRFIFIMVGGIGTALGLILIFFPLWEIKSGGGLVHPEQTLIVIIWLCIAVSIWDTIQTLEELNSRALVPDLIRDQKTRTKLQLVGAIISSIGLFAGVIMIPILLSIGGGETDPNAFFFMAIIIAVLYIAVLPFRAYGVWEPKEMRDFRYDFDILKKEKEPFWDAGKRAIKNKNWMAFVLLYLQNGLIVRILTLGFDLYVVDVLGLDISLATLPLIGMMGGAVTFGIISYKFLTKYGAKTTIMIGVVISTIGYFLMIFSIDILTLTLFAFISGVGLGLQTTARSLLGNQAIDDATLKNGKREEAQFFAVYQIVSATGKAWSAIIFALIVAIFLYEPLKGTENTEFAKFGLLFHISIIPMILCALSGIVVWKLCDITKEKAVENKEKLLKLGY